MEQTRTSTPGPSSALGTTGAAKKELGSPAFVEQDNWKYRSKYMKCGTCIFFVVKWILNRPQLEDHAIGRCRQCSPTMKGWPVVFSDDWCGAHKLDEEKI